MKNTVAILVALILGIHWQYGQNANGGEVEAVQFLAPSIQNNLGGENPMRSISIYLPPGYHTSENRYSTIYFLHGFATDDAEMFQWLQLKKLMDRAIESKIITPMIMVVPNSETIFGGSFYTNSPLIGNWSDFIAKDVVDYVDKNFRTIPNRENRGISGHSMGGNGALKIAMTHPEIFSAVYALSPAVLDWSEDFTMQNPGFRRISEYATEADILKGLGNFEENREDFTSFYAAVLVSMARAYATTNYTDQLRNIYPQTYLDGQPTVNDSVQKIWEKNFPLNMVEGHLPQLKSLKGIKLDWGRNEDFPHVPATALAFSKKLEANGIIHFSEEYLGDHVNKLEGFEGRIYTDMLPFFESKIQN